MGTFRLKTIASSVVSFFVFALCTSAAESSLNDLPQPDMRFELIQRFYRTNEYVFVLADVEDTAEYKNIWTKCKMIKPDVSAIVKHANELTEQDYSKRIFVCGPIDGFEKWDAFGLPIERIPGGFRFGTYEFTDKDDGIFFMSSDATRVVYTGNSLGPMGKLLGTMCGLYQYTIVQHGVPAHAGNFIDGQFNSSGHIDFRKEREKQLNRQFESEHYVFHYSDKACSPETIKSKAAAFDEYCDEAVARLELKKPDYKITCYIYSDENEKFLLSLIPGPGGVTYGNEIHALGFDAIEHESVHVLFNSAVAQPNNNFFNEGIRQYYEFITDPENLEKGRQTVRKYLDEPIEKWADESINFFNTPVEDRWYVAYPASGLFVKCLIDNHGLDKFKQFYKLTDVEAGFQDVYGTPLDEMVKQWIKEEQE